MTTKKTYKATFIELPGGGIKANKTQIKMTSETKCSFCPGSICCTYFTEQIDTPRSKKDFDHLLWQLSHANTQLYKDDEGWFLLVNNKCKHMHDNGRCGIYETRPQVCRDYSNDYCEYDERANKHFEQFFDGYEALLKYCKKRFKKWDERFK